jgi:hypothetical protein
MLYCQQTTEASDLSFILQIKGRKLFYFSKLSEIGMRKSRFFEF